MLKLKTPFSSVTLTFSKFGVKHVKLLFNMSVFLNNTVMSHFKSQKKNQPDKKKRDDIHIQFQHFQISIILLNGKQNTLILVSYAILTMPTFALFPV